MKTAKKAGFHPLSRRYIFEKTTGVQIFKVKCLNLFRFGYSKLISGFKQHNIYSRYSQMTEHMFI